MIEELTSDKTELYTIKTCIVAEAIKGKDSNGYDILIIKFTDGHKLLVIEQGQTGYFSVDVVQ